MAALVSSHVTVERTRTVEEAVLSVGLAGPLLPPGAVTLPALAVTAVTCLRLIVLGQLARIQFILLELAAWLGAWWLWWGHLFGLEAGI